MAWLDLKRIHLEPKDPAARAAELARALAMELPAASFHVPLSPSLPLGCLDAPPEEGEAKVDGPAAPRSWGAVSGAALTGPDGYGRVLCSAASGDGASAELAFEGRGVAAGIVPFSTDRACAMRRPLRAGWRCAVGAGAALGRCVPVSCLCA